MHIVSWDTEGSEILMSYFSCDERARYDHWYVVDSQALCEM